LWLLVQRSDLWSTLDAEAHDLLAGQASPYDAFFGCLERSFHEHGPLGREALLSELRILADGLRAVPVVSRVAGFHDPEPDADLAKELGIVFDWLRLKDTDDDLQLLFESGDLSPEVQERAKELQARRSHLKALLAKAPESVPR
jgi:DNA primase